MKERLTALFLFQLTHMSLRHRLQVATKACLIHLGISALVASVSAVLVFYVWYPFPYGQLVGGKELFLLVMSVDVVCGPLLTLVVFSDQKPRKKLVRDIGIIGVIQLAALAYGLHSVMIARPVFLAFEGDRFRVTTVPDIDMSRIDRAPESMRSLPLTGPEPIGAALAKGDDPEFLESIRLSMSGLHPAFRPDRWRLYDEYREQVRRAAMPLAKLRERYPEESHYIDEQTADIAAGPDDLGYLPLLAGRHTDWVVVLTLSDGQPRAYLHLDGWE